MPAVAAGRQLGGMGIALLLGETVFGLARGLCGCFFHKPRWEASVPSRDAVEDLGSRSRALPAWWMLQPDTKEIINGPGPVMP